MGGLTVKVTARLRGAWQETRQSRSADGWSGVDDLEFRTRRGQKRLPSHFASTSAYLQD